METMNCCRDYISHCVIAKMEIWKKRKKEKKNIYMSLEDKLKMLEIPKEAYVENKSIV